MTNTPLNSKVVVVGASTAGFTLATELRELGFSGEITLISDEPQLPYNRTALTKRVLANTQCTPEVMLTSETDLKRLQITLLRATKATALDKSASILQLTNSEGSVSEIHYGTLVIASGMRARRLGENFPSDIFYLRSLSETLHLAESVQNVSSVCVIGSGILGLELASTLSELGKTVTVMGDSMASVVNNFGAEIAQAITDDLEKSGVKIIIDLPPKGAKKIGNKYLIEQASGEQLEADLLVAAVGSDTNDEWLENSGLATGFGVWADLSGRVTEGIYAIGDVANWSDSPSIPTRHPKTQMSAINQARTVARQIVAAEPLQWPAPLFWTELLKQKIQVFGEAAESCEPVYSSERGGKVSIHRRGSKVVGVTAVAMPKEFTKTRAKYETEINQAWRS